jgi:hypothetical protein
LHLIPDSRNRRVIEQAERFADHLASRKELAASRAAAPGTSSDDGKSTSLARAVIYCAAPKSMQAVYGTLNNLEVLAVRSGCGEDENRALANLFREIAGNPYRRPAVQAHWPATVMQLAEALYAGNDCAFALHDALLEAGLTEFAEHFQMPGHWHPKGCWAVDMILGKK